MGKELHLFVSLTEVDGDVSHEEKIFVHVYDNEAGWFFRDQIRAHCQAALREAVLARNLREAPPTSPTPTDTHQVGKWADDETVRLKKAVGASLHQHTPACAVKEVCDRREQDALHDAEQS